MAYIEFWRQWKNFSGKTSRADYWAAIFTHIFLSVILMVTVSILLVAAFDLSVEDAIHYFDIFWTIYGMIWLVLFLSLNVRRLRDAGYNKKNFWKLFIPWRGLFSLFANGVDESNKSEEM